MALTMQAFAFFKVASYQINMTCTYQQIRIQVILYPPMVRSWCLLGGNRWFRSGHLLLFLPLILIAQECVTKKALSLRAHQNLSNADDGC